MPSLRIFHVLLKDVFTPIVSDVERAAIAAAKHKNSANSTNGGGSGGETTTAININNNISKGKRDVNNSLM